MKKIIFPLLIVFLFGFVSPLVAQVEVSGKYENFYIYIKYLEYEKGKYDIRKLALKYKGHELPKYISDLEKERNNAVSDLKKAKDKLERLQTQSPNLTQSQPQSQSPKTEDSLLRQQNNTLLENKWMLEDLLKDMHDTVKLLHESVRLLHDSLDTVSNRLFALSQKQPVTEGPFQHVGAYIRLGCPFNFFNQKDTSGNKIWNRQITFSQQVGLYWNSASFYDKLPMSYGVGLEFSRMRFSAGIGHLSDTIKDLYDEAKDHYIAYYTYNNVAESATLHYISIPLSFSIGTPRTNRISGYFQASLVPSFLIHSDFSTSGVYSCAGLYDTISGTHVSLYLDDCSTLGFDTFGSDSLQAKKTKKEDVLYPFMLSGRLAGGVYIPLCNTSKGQTSPWVIKVGVNLDMGFIFGKKTTAEYPKAKYHLDQYNIFAGSGKGYFNPGLEVGVIYMFNK